MQKGLSVGWKNLNSLLENDTYNGKRPLEYENKYLFIPIIYIGNFSTSQAEEILISTIFNDSILEINFETKINDFSLPSAGQPFSVAFIPKNCRFYIKFNKD